MKANVSIIMPAYNMAKYIEQSINSVQQQTFKSWELIVVNDGSRDDTAAIVRQISDRDNRVRLISQKNMGVSVARNTGINLSTGEYLSFLDADDKWYPTFLEEMLATIVENTGKNLVYCGYEQIFDSGKKQDYKYEFCEGSILIHDINGRTWVPIQGIIVEKEILNKYQISFAEGCAIGEDLEFLFKLLAVSNTAYVPKTLVTYAVRANSSSSINNWEKHLHVVSALQRTLVFCKDHLQKNDYQIVARLLKDKMAKSLFRILWRMLKNKELAEDVLEILQDKSYKEILSNINLNNMRLNNRIQYWLLTSENRFVWKLIGK